MLRTEIRVLSMPNCLPNYLAGRGRTKSHSFGNDLTNCSRGLLSKSSSVCSVSIRPELTPSLALNSRSAGAWKRSLSRTVEPLVFSGEGRKSVTHRVSAMVTSAEPEIPTNDITIQKLEEEVWEGCNLQHGEMSADGVKIHFVEAGDPAGKLVVLLHGFPNFWFVWRNQFGPLVDAGYHVIAPDMRGYNLSSKFESIQDYGRAAVLPDVEKLIDYFGAGKPAILVGHDWGAAIAWAFVEDYQSKVERMVSTNMGRGIDFLNVAKSNFRQILKSWYMVFFQISFIPEGFYKMTILKGINSIKSVSSGATDEDIKRMVEATSRPGSVMGGISYYRAMFRGLWSSPDKTVPVINIPVTTLWGDRDAYLLPAVGETNTEKAPKFKLQHLPESGHWPMWDEPALYNKLLLEAISGDGEESTSN